MKRTPPARFSTAVVSAILQGMNVLREKAYAKLNLTMSVLFRRPDGYHSIDSLMQTVDLYDTVTIEKSRSIEVTCSGMILPYTNTARNAAELFRSATGHGCRIHLEKRIPSEAGLGGGSADAAAVLRGLNSLYEEYLPYESLLSMAVRVGADVPFLLRGGLQRAMGIGEILTPLPHGTLHFVIVKPEGGISTKALYTALSMPLERPDTAKAAALLAESDAISIAPYLKNAMEKDAERMLPEIRSVRNSLLGKGALTAVMTGSGSAVFGLFRSEEEAERAAGELSGSFPFVKKVRSV